MRTASRSLLVGVALLLLASCGGGQGQAGSDAQPVAAPATAAATDPALGPGAPEAAPATSLVARAGAELAVYDAPGDPAPSATLPPTTGFGSARALLVVGDQPGWLQVSLPTRPNGATGWVRAGDVEVRQVDEAVVIDLAARQLTLVVGGEEVLRSEVAVGSPDAPTPTGSFYVVDKLATPGGSGPYGPFALGLSGHSEVLTEFAGGDGQIGLHGTDDPASIGQAVSHGCVRVPNDVITALSDLVPLGTPVTIR